MSLRIFLECTRDFFLDENLKYEAPNKIKYLIVASMGAEWVEANTEIISIGEMPKRVYFIKNKDRRVAVYSDAVR